MKTIMFSVFDTKAAFYGTPFFMQEEAAAIRAFGDLVNDDRSAVNKHPEDYSLYRVGQFDDKTGDVVHEIPLNLVTASSLVNVRKARAIEPDVLSAALLSKNGEKEKQEVN